jgi:hypothetical protein
LVITVAFVRFSFLGWGFAYLNSELCGAGKTGEAIKAEEQQEMSKQSIKMEIPDETADPAGNSQ